MKLGQCVIIGGVVTTSPFEAFAAYEQEVGLPADTIRRINSTNPDTNAWAQFERSEVDVDGFVEAFEAEGRAIGLAVDGHHRQRIQRRIVVVLVAVLVVVLVIVLVVVLVAVLVAVLVVVDRVARRVAA